MESPHELARMLPLLLSGRLTTAIPLGFVSFLDALARQR
jgi:hypothetical protein